MTDTQLPKLSTLSPETRRILCAETLGWKEKPDPYRMWYFLKGVGYSDKLPDPDLNANDALALVEHLRAKGLEVRVTFRDVVRCFVYAPTNTGAIANDLAHVNEPTFQLALTSAFLIATNKAQP